MKTQNEVGNGKKKCPQKRGKITKVSTSEL
jgi:hypothetical protein